MQRSPGWPASSRSGFLRVSAEDEFLHRAPSILDDIVVVQGPASAKEPLFDPLGDVLEHKHLDQDTLEARVGERARGTLDDPLLDPVDVDLEMVREQQAKATGEVV